MLGAWGEDAFVTILRGPDAIEEFSQRITNVLAKGADGKAEHLTAADTHAVKLILLLKDVNRRLARKFPAGTHICDLEDTQLYEVALPIVLQKILGTDRELNVTGDVCTPRVKQGWPCGMLTCVRACICGAVRGCLYDQDRRATRC